MFYFPDSITADDQYESLKQNLATQGFKEPTIEHPKSSYVASPDPAFVKRERYDLSRGNLQSSEALYASPPRESKSAERMPPPSTSVVRSEFLLDSTLIDFSL
jgi:hypothetical protein